MDLGWLNGAVDWLGNAINSILSWICYVLPDSPFKMLEMTPIKDYLGYINYFVPIDFMLSTLSAWGVAILVYYGYQIIMRWIKAIN